MKYQNLASFERHLSEAYPGHLSRAYMLISGDEVERRRLAEKIAGLLLQKEGERRLVRLGSDGAFAEFLELVQTKPLLGSHWVILLEGIELLKKEEALTLSAYLAKPSPFAYLVCFGAKQTIDFYQQAKKELVLLDMSEEKPWDKKRRLKEWLIAEAGKEKKVLAEDAALFLLEGVGTERAALEQELFKLLTFAAEKKTITQKEAVEICSNTQSLGLWKAAEHLIWEDRPLPQRVKFEETGDLLAFIAQLRSQLDTGLRLLAGETRSLRPQQLDKYRVAIRRVRPDFFVRALTLLFETELEAKNNSLSPSIMGDLLLSKLTFLRQYGAPSSS